MSFDQPIYSFQLSGEGPPTPTRTPTSPSFFNSVFETPRQDSKEQNLQSPWGNAFANALSPSFKTPNFATFGPLTPNAQGTSTGRDIEAEINTHEQLSQATIPDSQPGDEGQLSTIEPFDLADFDLSHGKPQDALKASIDTNVSSAGSMQTPPPTSTSASRRKAQQAQVARITKDGKNGRRLSSPSLQPNDLQFHRPSLEESPMQFPNLQFSPDGYSFSVSGPATAPVYPQQKIFWDTNQGSSVMNLDMSVDDTFNALGITSQRLQDPFSDDMIEMPTFTTSPSTHTLQQSVAMSQGHAPALNQPNMSSSTAMVTKGSSFKNRGMIVNPSLIFSSPSRAIEDDRMPQDEIMQPYSQQIRDARLEQEAKAKKQKRKRPPELGESPAVTAATEALREGSTTSSKSSPVIADSFFGALPEGPPQLESALPPRKRMTPDNNYQKQKGGLSRKRSNKKTEKRPSVSLKIDASGRAVTETSFVRNGLGKMDIDSDTDGSDSSSPTENLPHSQSKSSQQRRTRFADDPYSHSQRSSETSTLTSGRSGSRLQGTLAVNSGRASVHFQSSQHSAVLDDSSEASTVVDSDEDRGDAQSELRKIVQERSVKKTQSKAPTKSLQKQGKRLSFAPDMPKANPYYRSNTHATPTHYNYPDIPNNSSPTTITDPDLATPGSGYAGSSNASTTRCVCGSLDGKGGFMIQCESCRKWLHTTCVGLGRNNVPDVYLCTFCTSTPRAIRGRGQREPQRGMFPPPQPHLSHPHQHQHQHQMASAGDGSPLGYKSGHGGFR